MKQMMVSCFAKADTEYFSYDGSAKYTKLSIQHTSNPGWMSSQNNDHFL